MTYTRFSPPTLFCDGGQHCDSELKGAPESSPDVLRGRARAGGWSFRNHMDFCARHKRRSIAPAEPAAPEHVTESDDMKEIDHG